MGLFIEWAINLSTYLQLWNEHLGRSFKRFRSEWLQNHCTDKSSSTAKDYLQVQADLSVSSSVEDIFTRVIEELGHPSVVAYNGNILVLLSSTGMASWKQTKPTLMKS